MTIPVIYQIHYRDEQKACLDPAFLPFDNAGATSPLLEFDVFRRIHRSRTLKKGDLWGAVSWKFTDKTGLSGAELLAFIARHPGFDVYYCNPHPQFEATYPNLWLQGETAHPDFIPLCETVFQLAGLPAKHLVSIQPARAFASTNYIVATPAFWRAYIRFMDRVLARVFAGASEDLLARLHSSAADMHGIHAGANYLPFIVERLFSVFLASPPGRRLAAIKYPLPAKESSLNVHLRHLRDLKDMACASRSGWLASCWMNYRNLYLAQQHGRDWLKCYFTTITPRRIVLADFPAEHAKVAGR